MTASREDHDLHDQQEAKWDNPGLRLCHAHGILPPLAGILPGTQKRDSVTRLKTEAQRSGDRGFHVIQALLEMFVLFSHGKSG
jgi:hypothetical protein